MPAVPGSGAAPAGRLDLAPEQQRVKGFRLPGLLEVLWNVRNSALDSQQGM